MLVQARVVPFSSGHEKCWQQGEYDAEQMDLTFGWR